MPSDAAPPRTIPLPLSGWRLAVLLLAFLLPGLFGHDPWKTEDAIGQGLVYSMLDGGVWLTPQLAGEAYFEDGPLHYWLAAATAWLAAVALPLHDGARLATLVAMAAALYFTRLAARELYGKRSGDLSVLALLGCVGLMAHAHEVMAETSMLGFLAAAYYGIAIAWKKPVKAGICFGLGAGGAFLAKGIIALIPPALAALVLVPVAVRARASAYLRAVLIGTAVLVPVVVSWPLAVARIDPFYFDGWSAYQWQRLAMLPQFAGSLDYLKTLAWAAWPVWPLALWAGWAFRRNFSNPGFAVPMVASVVSFAILLLDRAPRETDALALLVPLAIPAGAAAMTLRRGAANALSWFSLITFGLLALAIWVMWIAMQTGFPARLAANVARLEPGFVPTLGVDTLLIALAFTATWIWFVCRAELTTLRSLPFWASGIALIWGLAMTLWIGWIDYGKTYRPVAEGIAAQLATHRGCVASRGLGDVQRAAFHYHAGILTQRLEIGPEASACRLLLIQTTDVARASLPRAEWQLLWEGGRPRDRERYWLYRRLD